MEELKTHVANMSSDDFKNLMKKAEIRKKFIETLDMTSLDDNAIEWVREQCNSIKNRIEKLTPNRKDLRDSWNTQFDIDLFVQMFRNRAVDENDADAIVNILFDRIQMLCAPSQDEAVLHAKQTILLEKSTSKKLAVLLEISNDIVTDIETLAKNFADGF